MCITRAGRESWALPCTCMRCCCVYVCFVFILFSHTHHGWVGFTMSVESVASTKSRAQVNKIKTKHTQHSTPKIADPFVRQFVVVVSVATSMLCTQCHWLFSLRRWSQANGQILKFVLHIRDISSCLLQLSIICTAWNTSQCVRVCASSKYDRAQRI